MSITGAIVTPNVLGEFGTPASATRPADSGLHRLPAPAGQSAITVGAKPSSRTRLVAPASGNDLHQRRNG